MKNMENELPDEFYKLTQELGSKLIPLIQSTHPAVSGHCFIAFIKALIRDAYLHNNKEFGLKLKTTFIRDIEDFFNDLENGKIK